MSMQGLTGLGWVEGDHAKIEDGVEGEHERVELATESTVPREACISAGVRQAHLS